VDLEGVLIGSHYAEGIAIRLLKSDDVVNELATTQAESYQKFRRRVLVSDWPIPHLRVRC